MARPRVAVQHMVACPLIRRYGNVPTSDLLGVAYTYTYTPDLEFPRHLAQLDLFARLFIFRPGQATFQVRVWRLGADDASQTRMGRFGPFRVDFEPGYAFLDQPFRLRHVRLEGVGRYAIRLCQLVKRRWRGEGYRVLATEFLQVMRPS